MKTSAAILVVEDEPDMLKGLTKMLSREGHDVESISTGTEAMQRLDEKVFDVVITDLRLPGCSGMEILKKLKETSPESVGIVITGYATVESAVEAMKLGTYDYIPKPFDMQKVKIVVRNALDQSNLLRENKYLKKKIDTEWQVEHIIGKSTSMKKVFEEVEKVASTDATVLLFGESGTGKELIARYVHHLSPRKGKLFMAVNCSMLREVFLESELFGHVKGAFTGAVASKKGLLEIADDGTFFLDEISEVSLPVQAKLLRVIEERSFMRLGGTETIKVDIRLIAATNKNLEKCIEEGRFRDDLYYRLNVFSIRLPSLRERRDDIPLLAYHFLRQHCKKLGKHVTEFSPEAMEALQNYDWPGNVRELANAIERGLILAGGTTFSAENLPGKVASAKTVSSPASPAVTYREAKQASLDNFNKDFVRHLLERHEGNITRAAQEAGMDRANFHRLMRNAGVEQDGPQ
jgi:DNA-binding NtrC family response regulator